MFNNLINAKKDMDPNFSILITSLLNKTTKLAIMDTVSKRSNKDIVIPTTLRIKGYDGNFVAPTYYQIDKYMMSGAKKWYEGFQKKKVKYYFLEEL